MAVAVAALLVVVTVIFPDVSGKEHMLELSVKSGPGPVGSGCVLWWQWTTFKFQHLCIASSILNQIPQFIFVN
jgi:hypothetical protein